MELMSALLGLALKHKNIKLEVLESEDLGLGDGFKDMFTKSLILFPVRDGTS